MDQTWCLGYIEGLTGSSSSVCINDPGFGKTIEHWYEDVLVRFWYKGSDRK